MLRNYLKIAYRHLLKHKAFSLINVFGLAIGMAAGLLIWQYVRFELSYDDFRKPTVYRAIERSYQNGELSSERAQTVPALAPALVSDMPEVVRAARLIHADKLMSDPVMQVDDRSFHEEKVYFADSSFLRLLSYSMMQGDLSQALTQPASVVISESMARKYFLNQNAVGQTMVFHQGDRGTELLNITGVFADIPVNSHLHTDFIVSFSTIPPDWNLDENWEWGNFYNYLEVIPGTAATTVSRKVASVYEKHRGEVLDEWRQFGYSRVLDTQPVQSIHLDSHLEAEAETNGSRRTVEFLGLIAIFILLIAWVNYLNLTTAKSVERAREVGIRKVVGSGRGQLIAQFVAESLLVNTLAVGIAIALSELLVPVFSDLTGGHLVTNFDQKAILVGASVFLAGVILSSLYPALVLSSYQPEKVLKGTFKRSKQGVWLRKGLVVFQFAASVALIAGTLVVQQQLSFMRQQELGLDLDRTVVVKGPGIKDSTYQQHLTYFKNEASRLPTVREVSVSSSVPGGELSWARAFYPSAQPDNRVGAHIVAVDEDFFDLYGARFKAGRNFSREFSSDRSALIFNETAARQLGYESVNQLLSQPVVWEENENDLHTKQVIGVVEDFHQESLHQAVGPMVFVLKRYLNAPWAGEYYSLKLNTSDYPATLAQIEKQWQGAFPGSPFAYFFLDEHFAAQYRADQQFGRIFSLFAGLAILIACLGLFGLSSYLTLQRTQEIGIRKVLGASVPHVVALLSQDFIRLIVVASLVALPIVYWGAELWLENFAYRTVVRWWWLIVPVGLVGLLAVLTISFQTVRAALANPVDSLRNE